MSRGQLATAAGGAVDLDQGVVRRILERGANQLNELPEPSRSPAIRHLGA